ncbi:MULTISPECIES: hypothetical protein [Streptomyces]|uniref:hypothetical protein n=1 Tax=unclassified Streptomyces TaxID=2593676 RepID=UPI001F0DDEA2|nr:MULTISPECIES: hypothetical protein [Streptomyces]
MVGASRGSADTFDHAYSRMERDTVNTTQLEGVDRSRRLRALHELQDLVCDGALDTDVLLDKRNYRC